MADTNKPKKKKERDVVAVRLEPDLLQRMKQIAEAEDRTVSSLGRIAIREFLERRTAAAA